MYDKVKEYYGTTLQGSDDLQTNACCTDEGLPEYLKPVLSKIHDEVMARYYGCGLIAPEALQGMRILDLAAVPAEIVMRFLPWWVNMAP